MNKLTRAYFFRRIGDPMKKLLFGILISLPLIQANEYKIPYVAFDAAMKPESARHVMQDRMWADFYARFKQLYEAVSPARIDTTVKPAQPRIPHKIHIIWLGSPFPEKYRAYMQSWIDFHPTWELRLWTDADVATFPWKNRALFDRATNYGEKSDIWKYEIVEEFGGVYVDTDEACLKELDAFHDHYDFYLALQPLDTNSVQVGLGIFGAIPHHPLLQAAIQLLPYQQHIPQIIARTGPIFFTKVFLNFADKTGLRDIALPAPYFYPCGYYQKGMSADVWYQPEAYAVHHWEGSWLNQK